MTTKHELTDEQNEIIKLRVHHLKDLLVFIRAFFKLRTGRPFELSDPIGRESHYLTIARALERVINGECKRLIINCPPRYSKTEMLIHFVAWTMARYPDSNFLYVSYSHTLAKRQTETIRNIVTLPYYKALFGVTLKDDSTAKDNFQTTQGGSVYAAGSQGTITGFGAGIKGCSRFGGCVVIDDALKPDEATSDTIRESVNEWYYNTLQSRLNNPNTPIIFIGQRLHEHDLAAVLLESGEWESIIIPAIDGAGNALHPQMHDLHTLYKMQEESPYNFAAQYQQTPQPAGGGIFKPEWFVKLEIEPPIQATFITVDTAETSKEWNDATVFSFWGLYKIDQEGLETDIYGLHWLDCREVRIEPKDLRSEFMDFYRSCMAHKVKPRIAAIEKKSTGVTLVSTLKSMQGLQVLDIERTKASGNKVSRYLEIQPYVSQKRISLPAFGAHTEPCIDHMKKITANNSHRFCDVADTLYDSVKLALIDEVILRKQRAASHEATARFLMSDNKLIDRLKKKAYAG